MKENEILEIPVNEFQSKIDEKFLEGMSDTAIEQLYKFIGNVPYIQNLISPNRQRAKDRPRDDEGRIIVDLSNPHILENMSYFTEAADHFRKHGVYTFLRPNPNPNSPYKKWIDQEIDRCWNGHVRPSDGEWIPGELYFILNYMQIELTEESKSTRAKSKNVAVRRFNFPEIWEGLYLRFHYLDQARNNALHGMELASRTKGKSYSMAGTLGRNFLLGTSEEAYRDITSVILAQQKEFLINDGTLNKFVSVIDFCYEHTQFPRLRLRSSLDDMTWKLGYTESGNPVEKGLLNTVMGMSSNNDISKIRGKRTVFLGIEEYGTFKRLVELYNIMKPLVQEGDYVFGLMYFIGTAGDENSDFAGAQELLYNPIGYDMYAIPNVYDELNSGRSQFVYFFPGYMNRKGCYNKDGVSDVILAIKQILIARDKIRNHSRNPNTIIQSMAEIPITPAEAVIKSSGNLFPKRDIMARIREIDENPSFYQDAHVGDLVPDGSGGFKFEPTHESPIRHFPHGDNKIEGAIEIFEMPQKGPDGLVYPNRYILGADTYDDDVAETLSLGSIFVLDLWTDQIVGEYTGRPARADDFYEICRRLTIFYRGKLNYENNKKGLFGHFSRMNSTHYLTDVLDYLKDRQMQKGSFIGNTAKGTYSSLPIKIHGLERYRSWLMRRVDTKYMEDGQEKVKSLYGLYSIKNRALLLETQNYNSEGNFDRVSAMIQLMILREDYMIKYKGEFKKEEQSNYLGNDPFFDMNPGKQTKHSYADLYNETF